MIPWLLVATHVFAFTVGCLVVWEVVRRFLRVRPTPDGHTALEVVMREEGEPVPFRKENRHFTVSLILLIASLFVVAVGAQAYVAAKDNAERDRADRAYADCLTGFAAQLTRALDRSREALVALEDARARKDATLDRLLVVTELARRTPPQATDEEFNVALRARIRAQANYDDVRTALERVQSDNPYRNPKVVCQR